MHLLLSGTIAPQKVLALARVRYLMTFARSAAVPQFKKMACDDDARVLRACYVASLLPASLLRAPAARLIF